MSEAALQDVIRLALGDYAPRGAVFWRNNTGLAEHWTPRGVQRVRYGLAPGSADIVGVVRGRFVAFEVKTDTGRVSPEQRQWLDLVTRCGGVARVVRSVAEARDAVEGLLASAVPEISGTAVKWAPPHLPVSGAPISAPEEAPQMTERYHAATRRTTRRSTP